MSARTSSSISSHVDPQTRFAGYFGVGEILRHHGERDEAIRIKRRMLDDLPAVSDRPLYGRDLGPWNRRCSPTWPTWSSTSASSAPHESHAQQALAIREQDGHPWGIAHALNALVAIAASRGDFPEARALQERVVTLMRDSQLIPAETVQEELALAELELLCAEPSLARQRLATVDVAEIVRVGDLPAAAEALRIFAMCLASSGALEEAAFLIGAYGDCTERPESPHSCKSRHASRRLSVICVDSSERSSSTGSQRRAQRRRRWSSSPSSRRG